MSKLPGKDGPTKRPSISDVAAMAGVSTSAVSKVLRDAYGVSPLMRATVENAIKKLGYRPRPGARAMRGKSQLIGVQVPNFGNDFFTQIIDGIQARLAGTEFEIVIAVPGRPNNGHNTLEALVDHQVDGILAVALEVPPEEILKISRETPIVVIGRHDSSHEYDSVFSDDFEGTKLALQYLYDQGHRQIVHVTLKPTFDRSDAKNPHSVRLLAYETFMQSHGLKSQVLIHNFGSSGLTDEVRELFENEPKPTAIFAGHDELALEVLGSLTELGLTTKDVALIGYDDTKLAAHPLIGLTTVRQFGEQLGKTATELLLERISGERETASHVSVMPKMIVRETTPQP
ncbi:MAG: hypothetical protein RL508_375 [Actinomycetota bacterium]|jgi:LacI family transcriptional regulator